MPVNEIDKLTQTWTELMAVVHCFSVGVQSLTLTAHRTFSQRCVLIKSYIDNMQTADTKVYNVQQRTCLHFPH